VTIASWSFGLTWQHLLRTLAIAALGAAALAVASQARAEGGDPDSLISPDQAAEFLNAAAAEAVAPAEEKAAEAADTKKPAKSAKGTDKKKAKEALASKAEPAKQDKAQAGSTEQSAPSQAAEATQQEEGASDETASLPAVTLDSKLKLRASGTVRAGTLKPLIARYASENGLPYELADAVVRLESRYNAGARNGPNMGLTQINVRTAQSLGYQGPAAGLLDAETNLRYGLKYLAKAYKLAGGDTCGTILRYQFGHRTQTMTGASRAYCAKVKVITAAAE
jgi:soluble lytic murein transglycosylase-like protein